MVVCGLFVYLRQYWFFLSSLPVFGLLLQNQRIVREWFSTKTACRLHQRR